MGRVISFRNRLRGRRVAPVIARVPLIRVVLARILKVERR